ncbi:hypothetical protein [Natrinema salifodinae]|uniref:Uncharacterized protein n=1 Tax=Natrinema salifodinae TaxID=1202768 RepID=A0A1I0N7Y0_9EURY|nr:hypothetical protein [Natrinema salifodinae]SEV97047.1 hypothetical protein SAMN05216285_1414 [Natrinema salifodinae]
MNGRDGLPVDTGRESFVHELTVLPRELQRRNPILFWTATGHAVLLLGFLVGLAADPRIVSGDPVWLKPAKFAASIGLFTGVLAWLTPHLSVSRKFRRLISWGIAIAAVIEITAIAGQAARGTRSHFNYSTTFDTAVYLTMGLVIITMTLLVAWLFIRAARNGFDVHPAFALGITLGGGLFVTGAFEGGVMIALNTNTVGTGYTLPVVGWTLVGDFRVAHFVGLHALQVLPLAGYLAAIAEQRGQITDPKRLVRLVGCIYGGTLFVAFFLAIAPLVA